MQVTQTAVNSLKHEFKVVLSTQDIEAKVTDRLTELGSQVRVPGFRPVRCRSPFSKKRPRVRARRGGRACARRQLATGHHVAGLRPALRPKIEITSFEKGSDLEYKLAIEVLPKIEPMDFSTLVLERLVAEVTGKEEEEALLRLAGQYKRSEPAPAGHKAGKGDIAVIDFEGTIEDKEFPAARARATTSSSARANSFPASRSSSRAWRRGRRRRSRSSFPADYGAEALRGKQASFAVTLKEVRRPAESKVDEQLAKDLGFESLEALRKSVREQLEREYGELCEGAAQARPPRCSRRGPSLCRSRGHGRNGVRADLAAGRREQDARRARSRRGGEERGRAAKPIIARSPSAGCGSGCYFPKWGRDTI